VKKVFPIPPYLPDQTPNSGTLVGMKNAIPIVDGYGPVKDFQEVSDAIDGDFLGGAAVIADDGTSYLLVGTSTKLQRYSSGSWTDLVTSLSITDQWKFAGFGNFVVAVNGSATYAVDLSAGTAATITDSPAGKSVTVVGDYVVIGQDTDNLISVFTSDINDHTDWDTSGGATEQPQLVGGEVMGLAGGEYGVILQRRRIVRQSRTGDSALPFDYDAITDNVGCASKGSVTQWGRSVFFLADQGFMALDDGQVLRPIGTEKVDRTFQALVPPDDYERIFSAVDPVRKLVIWCVPGSPGFLFIYNYELDKWGVAELDVQGVFSAFTSSDTLEGVSASNPDLDAMTLSLDDPSFAGGNPQLYIVQGGKIGTLSGATLEAAFDLGFMELAPGRRSRVRAIRPVTDCVDGQAMELLVSERQGGAGVVRTGGGLTDSGRIPFRASGRYHRLSWEIAAGSDWTYVQGFEVDFEVGGER
jgi:hypothetical protein